MSGAKSVLLNEIIVDRKVDFMNEWYEQAKKKLEAQQAKVKEHSPQWMVGEQLKDICRREPRSAELIAQDLENASMSITEAEKKIKACADSHKTGNFSCVTPVEAEQILREFYGLPRPDEAKAPPSPFTPVKKLVDPMDFL